MVHLQKCFMKDIARQAKQAKQENNESSKNGGEAGTGQKMTNRCRNELDMRKKMNDGTRLEVKSLCHFGFR